MDGSADIIMTSVTMTKSRFQVLDFLQPWFYRNHGIHILKKGASKVSIELDVFFLPFHKTLWQGMLLIAFISFMAFLAVDFVQSYPTLNILKALIAVIPPFFGQYILEDEKKGKAKQILMFTIFLFGTLSWSSYNAGFVADLSYTKITWPFDSLEGLLDSDYKLLTTDKSTTEGFLFHSAKNGSIYHELREKKMDEKSFGSRSSQAERLLTEENIAYFDIVDFIESLQVAKCKVQLVWKAPAFGVSVAFGKNFAYKEFLDIFLMKYFSYAYNDFYVMRNKDHEKCQESTNSKAARFAKLVLPFIILATGIFMAIILSTCENAKKRWYKRQGNLPLLKTSEV